MPYGHTYTFKHKAAVSTAITVVQAASGATTPFEIVRASATQRGSTTSAQEAIAIVRKISTFATVTAAGIGTHLFKDRAGDPTPDLQLGTALSGVIATAEGTDGDQILDEGFNVLNGWLHLPVPEKRFLVRAAACVVLKFFNPPANQNWQFMLEVRELG